ncbi:MAG: DUF4197 domain-containing protein [Rhodocyclaceae bacterium]|jgi:hypothetical protein|nr:DUF4197 domain-containing protein [Rhodocyclaceae bacterium]MCZ7654663.1 DUF4197 domain-containing protein [Rhodocyclaceae bacterium]
MASLMRIFIGLLWLVILAPVRAGGLDAISPQDSGDALRQALTQGASAAVASLGRKDGFLGNPKVRIPLPESLQTAEKLMRKLGMSKYADELVTTMNRAAEAAVPEARQLLVDAVKQMTLQDAKAILTGGDDSATQYFKRTTSAPLTEKFLPIVKQATEKVQLADKYNRYAKRAAKLGLLDKEDASLEHYVTQKALDGLFLMIAEEERAIRKDPVGQASGLLRKVFGALN